MWIYCCSSTWSVGPQCVRRGAFPTWSTPAPSALCLLKHPSRTVMRLQCLMCPLMWWVKELHPLKLYPEFNYYYYYYYCSYHYYYFYYFVLTGVLVLQPIDHYSRTKAIAEEMVLSANGCCLKGGGNYTYVFSKALVLLVCNVRQIPWVRWVKSLGLSMQQKLTCFQP